MALGINLLKRHSARHAVFSVSNKNQPRKRFLAWAFRQTKIRRIGGCFCAHLGGRLKHAKTYFASLVFSLLFFEGGQNVELHTICFFAGQKTVLNKMGTRYTKTNQNKNHWSFFSVLFFSDFQRETIFQILFCRKIEKDPQEITSPFLVLRPECGRTTRRT